MTDTVLLGGISVALGFYSLYLHRKCNMLHVAGMHATRLLVEQIKGENPPELDNLKKLIKEIEQRVNK